MKKTTDVKSIIEWGNTQLARKDEYATKKFKAGIATMTEKVLHESNNYNGFSFLHEGTNSVDSPEYYSRHYTLKQ